MPLKHILFSLSFIILATCLNHAYARQIPTIITSRMDGEDSSPSCWTAMWEIKSCMNEIENYLVNGTIDIGPQCCQAITIITHNCWPTALSAIGVTPAESDVLRGVCDALSPPGDNLDDGSGDDGVVSFSPVPSPIN